MDGNGVGIFVQSHFLADFHVDRDICRRAPGKEGGDRASFQTLENQRERVLADAPVYENRVGYEVDKQHRANQHGEKPSVFGKYL